MRVTTLGLALCAITFSFAADTTLIPLGSTWKYLDNGSNPGTAWRAPAYNDSTWKSGPAQLGYGDGDEATVVSYGPDPDNKYLTTYFRKTFTVADPQQFNKVTLNLRRDDGAVVYINGVEAFRSNMQPGATAYNTYAASALDPPDEHGYVKAIISKTLLQAGTNTIAVEVHQSYIDSSDLSFDLSLIGGIGAPPEIIRSPYLQTGTTNSMVIRWRTDLPTDSRVLYGTSQGVLTSAATDAAQVTDHIVRLTGLTPDTRYYYSVGSTTQVMAGGDANHYFTTAPPVGTVRPYRIWAAGDWQYGGQIARWVRDAYLGFTGSTRTDVWLTMGDNVQTGEDADYQTAVFDMFGAMMRNNVLWPSIGNHDILESSPPNPAYLQNFTLPVNGEAGGTPSGSPKYYSFDYGNIHFIALDSMSSDRSSTGPMLTWLRNDIAATRQRWIIGYFHHAPYSKATHDTDVEPRMSDMRRNALPILEAGGVDLVLAGHSHVYERSFLIDGHYGLSSTFTPAMKLNGGDGRPAGSGVYQKAGVGGREGTVYVVAGTGSAPGYLMTPWHPVMYTARDDAGSVVVDVNGDQLDVKFILADGRVWDYFTIRKNAPAATPAAPTNLVAKPTTYPQPVLSSSLPAPNAIGLAWTDASNNETGFRVERGTDGVSFGLIGSTAQNVATYTDTTAAPGTTYHYRVRAYNSSGNSAYSNVASTSIPVVPAAPSGLTAQMLSSTEIRLAWNDNSNNETGFRIRRSIDNVNFTVVTTLAAGTTTYTNTGLTGSITYHYRVTSYNASGESAAASASATTSSPTSITSAPAAPTQLRALASSSTTITLTWRDNAQARASFVVERLSGSAYVVIATVPAGLTAWLDTGRTRGTTYAYRVKARNSGGDSAYSNVASARTRN